MTDRTQAPIIKDAIDFTYHLPKINSRIADNKIPIHYYSSGSQDVIQIDWVFEGGLWHERKPAVAHAVGALLKSGTTLHNELEINEAIEHYGASLKVMISNDFSTISLSTLTKHLGHLLPIVHEVITMATMPEEELTIYKQNAIQTLRVRLLNCDFVANRHIEAMVWGKAHPYGRYADIIDIESLERADLMSYYQEVFSSQRCTIFVAGRFEEQAIDSIHHYFGHSTWNVLTQGLEAPHHPIMASSVMSMHVDNDLEGKQAAVRLSKEFVHRSHPDFVPFQLLNTVLGGYFGSRLMTNIREEKGYTYGIYSFIGAYRHNSMLMISSEVEKDQLQPTLDECYLEMRRLQTELIPEEELLLVKNYLLGGLLGDLDGPMSIMRFWKTILLNDMKEEEFYHNVSVYKSTDAATLRNLAQQYLDPETFYRVTVI